MDEKSSIIQISLSAKVSLMAVGSSIPHNKGNEVLMNNMKISASLTQFMIRTINCQVKKEQLSSNEGVIIYPSRLKIDLALQENKAENLKNVTLDPSVEPLNITISFKDIEFAKCIMGQVKEALDKMPKLTFESVDELIYAVNRTQINAKLEPMNISLIDNIGVKDIPLFKITVAQTALKLNQCVLKDESLRPNIESPEFLKVNAKFALEAYYYNTSVSEQEPVIESWDLEAEAIEIAPDHGKEIVVKAGRVLNLTLTYERKFTCNIILVAYAASSVLRQLQESSTPLTYDDMLSINETQKSTTKIMSEKGFLFENHTGFPIK